MATPPAFFHALLRPCILQVLRQTGYHATRPAVLDSLTDLAARYMLALCQSTAGHAEHNRLQPGDFDVTDVRLALQDVGALGPEKVLTEEVWRGEEDLQGVEEFISWFSGQKFKELMEVGNADGESDATDYLAALKKKHNKTGDDAKFQGTILGRPGEGVEVPVEGGPLSSIHEWMAEHSPQLRDQEAPASPSSASSGLSSVGDRIDHDEEMEGMAEPRRDTMDLS